MAKTLVDNALKDKAAKNRAPKVKATADNATGGDAPSDSAHVGNASVKNASTENAHLNNSADTVKRALRKTGFRLMLAFSSALIVGIVVTRADNNALALSVAIWCFVTSCAAMYFANYEALIAKLWAVVACPIAPYLVFSNGLLPASLIPLGLVFPIVFLSGRWRVASMAVIAGSTFVVPFYEGEYDHAVWVRLCITNVVVSILIYQLVSRLEAALIESNAKTIKLNHALALE
ncbi:hypothetical protein [Alteromonas sp. A079]|uniref:hypothetical protein n=1 Tax=Alteromonas sp. A079 TaxID=3410268 RepID=UPI003BA1FEED